MAQASISNQGMVVSSSSTSGLNILLHPLPLLNITEHYNRARLTLPPDSKLVGALLGTQVNRDISIVNSFEILLKSSESATRGEGSGDVDMSDTALTQANAGKYALDLEFYETRKEQFKAVFPTQEVVGWYTISTEPSAEDINIQQQFSQHVDNPIFLLFNTDHPSGSQDLPIKIYESSLDEPVSGEEGPSLSKSRFVGLDYSIESGEAERIAVDGVSRGGMGKNDEDAAVGNLVTQRNAIRMLYERISILSDYIANVAEKKVEPDHAILRQISSLVATLPTIDAPEFRKELVTEHEDVEITSYLANITKQISALSSYTDRHYAVYPVPSQFEDFSTTVQRGFKGRRR